MTDRVSAAQRSRNMARVKNRNTAPELLVRKTLHGMGFRFRLHRRDLPGNPDIVLPRYKTVVFVHGCFWHGHANCPRAARPQSNVTFWNEKLDRNIARDAQMRDELRRLGWNVLVIWQCQTKDVAGLERLVESYFKDIRRELHGSKRSNSHVSGS